MEGPDSTAGGFQRYDCAFETAHRVILWDEYKGSPQKICEIIRSAGAQPVQIHEISELLRVDHSAECCVAVTVTGAIPGGTGMQAIRDLKAKGFKVIACENGVGSWTIKIRCVPLLAGAVQLLDSSSAEFPSELREVIERIVHAEAQKRSEEQEVKATMRRLGMVGESATMLSVFRFRETHIDLLRSLWYNRAILIPGFLGPDKFGKSYNVKPWPLV